MGEVIFFIVFAALGVCCWLFLTGVARIFWTALFVVIELSVVLFEILGKLLYGKTISQMFWAWSELHPGTAWLVIGMLGVAFLMLLYHLAEKLIWKRKQ